MMPMPAHELKFTVHGLPSPQGSKRHVGKGVMVESSKYVKPWREAVKAAAIDANREHGFRMMGGSISATFRFFFSRPKSHYGAGKNTGKVKCGAPQAHIIKPDLSKLIRSTEDALVDAGVIRDDCLINLIEARKDYTTLAPYAIIEISEVEETKQ